MAARQRMSRARRALETATASGDPAAIAKAEASMQRADAALAASRADYQAHPDKPSSSTPVPTSMQGWTPSPKGETPPAVVGEGLRGEAPDSIPDRVRTAYEALAQEPRAWVRLADLRAMSALATVPRSEVDAMLLELNAQRRITVVPESNRKTITDADRAAGLPIGLDTAHLIRVE